MAKALESFKQYVMNEAHKGERDLRLSQYSYEKPKIFSKSFSKEDRSSGQIATNDEPTFIENTETGLSKEEAEELKGLGFSNESEIDYMSVKKVDLVYDIVIVWDAVGVETMLFLPKKITMVFEVDVYDQENDRNITSYVEVVDDNIGSRYEWDDAKRSFPIEPTGIEINMNRSFDPSEFYYEFTIGEW